MCRVFNMAWSLPIIFICFSVKAQELNVVDAQENLFKIGGGEPSYGIVRKFDNRYEGVKGSPFYFDYWADGSIQTSDNKSITNIELKYNVFEDDLIINRSEKGQYYFPKSEITSFTLHEKSTEVKQVFIKKPHPKKEAVPQYYRLVYPGEINLAEHTKVIFEKADFEGGYSNEKRYDEFKKYPTYYFYDNSSLKPKKLKLTINYVSNIFNKYKKEIKNHILQNGYDCANEQDLIKIFEYYHSIQ